jgi:hypothetical protein
VPTLANGSVHGDGREEGKNDHLGDSQAAAAQASTLAVGRHSIA